MILETRYLDAAGRAGHGYRLSAVNGLGAEIELGRVALQAPFIGIRAWPSPGRVGHPVNIAFSSPVTGDPLEGALVIGVHDVRGRKVADAQPVEGSRDGPLLFRWDGRDQDGRAVSSGIYFLSARSSAGPLSLSAEQRIVMVR
jgi:hypothetical protein